MARPKARAPLWCKWFIQDWQASTLRRRLKTATRRGIYRELWDICMSSPDPGAAVDSAGKSFSESDLASMIGCRIDHLKDTIGTAEAHGRITRGARDELRLCEPSIKKSLPEHWKYRRLGSVLLNKSQNKNTPRGRGRGRGRKKYIKKDEVEWNGELFIIPEAVIREFEQRWPNILRAAIEREIKDCAAYHSEKKTNIKAPRGRIVTWLKNAFDKHQGAQVQAQDYNAGF